jgi:hypothetical protein
MMFLPLPSQLSRVARDYALAAVPTAIEFPSASGASNVSGVPAVSCWLPAIVDVFGVAKVHAVSNVPAAC